MAAVNFFNGRPHLFIDRPIGGGVITVTIAVHPVLKAFLDNLCWGSHLDYYYFSMVSINDAIKPLAVLAVKVGGVQNDGDTFLQEVLHQAVDSAEEISTFCGGVGGVGKEFFPDRVAF